MCLGYQESNERIDNALAVSTFRVIAKNFTFWSMAASISIKSFFLSHVFLYDSYE